MKLQTKINYKEISTIISALKVQAKSFREVDMKKEANEVKRLQKKMERIYKKCELSTTLIYRKN